MLKRKFLGVFVQKNFEHLNMWVKSQLDKIIPFKTKLRHLPDNILVKMENDLLREVLGDSKTKTIDPQTYKQLLAVQKEIEKRKSSKQ